MAFAIASGLPPEAGIFTAIIAGTIISLLGGSRVQVGGPAGAFIVIVYGIVRHHGVSGLIIATIISGIILFAMGALRLGSLIRYIPMSVIVGFTNGIAVLIALSQIKDFFGLHIANMPGDFFGIFGALWEHRTTLSPASFILALLSLVFLFVWQKLVPTFTHDIARGKQWIVKVSTLPGPIVILVIATIFVALFSPDVETIGSRFGGVPSSLPHLTWPELNWNLTRPLFMPALTLALLGAIESLLCARVADDLISDRHDPNQELMAQGVANFLTPLFAGMPATGTIARTVTNIKAGAVSPIACLVHSATLLLVIILAAPLAAKIPLATLAAILLFISWNMGDWGVFLRLKNFDFSYSVVLLLVFFLTVIFDLTIAVQVGIITAVVAFIYRMSHLTRADEVRLTELLPYGGDVHVWRLHGVLFFGATSLSDLVEDRFPQKILVLDFQDVFYIDPTWAEAFRTVIEICHRKNITVMISGLSRQPLQTIQRMEIDDLLGEYQKQNLNEAVRSAVDLLAKKENL